MILMNTYLYVKAANVNLKDFVKEFCGCGVQHNFRATVTPKNNNF